MKESYCSACGQDFLKGELPLWCRLCLRVYHAGCWEKARGCTTSGCTGKPVLDPEHQTVNYKRCPFCGEEIVDFATKCRYCRTYLDQSVDTTREKHPPRRFRTAYRKDPILTCLLNLIFPGAGYMYLGKTWKGFFWFLVACAAWFFTRALGMIAVYLWVMYDSSKEARDINRQAFIEENNKSL